MVSDSYWPTVFISEKKGEGTSKKGMLIILLSIQLKLHVINIFLVEEK